MVYDFPDDAVVDDLNVMLVGGAVRDLLLGRPIQERDWVVLGATAQQMLDRGFNPVGKDFPVFLHPKTHEEFALARTEQKTGRGHQAFEFYAAPEVTLEEDLSRRDFTINAMAIDQTGQLHDPFNGRQDIEARRLRPVGDAFVEDPLRIFRAARFIAQLPEFQASPELLACIPSMRHEFASLSVERLWAETLKAFNGTPAHYFECLNRWRINEDLELPPFFVGAHSTGSPMNQLADWHSASTQPLVWPKRWRAPNDWLQLMTDARQWTLYPDSRVDLLLSCGVIKNTPRWQRMLSWLERHRNTDALLEAVDAARAIQASQFQDRYSGPELGTCLNRRGGRRCPMAFDLNAE